MSLFSVDENGFTAESSRGHRIVKWNGDSTTVQHEAMQFNLQLMKWRLFPSLDVTSHVRVNTRLSCCPICVCF